MKRFYTLTTTKKESGGWTVLLDDRPVNTPLKNKLVCSTESLADQIVLEWAGQEDIIKPETMLLTQILSTKIDQIATQRDVMSAEILKYLNTDLLCYRTEEPQELATAQAQAWDVWLSWFADKFGSTLQTTTDIKALEHPKSVHSAVKVYVEALDDDHFNILQLIASISGSFILSAAFIEQVISGEELFLAANVEEKFYATLYREDKYGPDPMQEKKDIAFKKDLEAAAQYLELMA